MHRTSECLGAYVKVSVCACVHVCVARIRTGQ